MRSSYQPRGSKRSPAVALTFIYRRVGLRPAVVSSARTYGLSWVAPSVALPRLNLCPYYSRSESTCQGFLENFLGSPSAIPRGSRLLHSDQRLAGLAVLGCNSREKDCAHPLGFPLLGSRGRPLEGLGFASPPDMIIIPYPGPNVNPFFQKS